MSQFQVLLWLVPAVLITLVMSSSEEQNPTLTEDKSIDTAQRLIQKQPKRVDNDKSLIIRATRRAGTFDTFL